MITTTGDSTRRMPRWLAILLVSMAGLLLEVGYTRIVSFKLWYYYTYLVIGLALLGIGSGGVIVAVSESLRRWTTERIIAVFAIGGGISIAFGYWIIAKMHIDTVAIWDYGTKDSYLNLIRLFGLCFWVFAAFIALGVIVSVLLGRAGDGVGRIYMSDLVGAGIGCLLAIPLIVRLGPPRVILLAAVIFAVVGLFEISLKSAWFAFGTIVTILLIIPVAAQSVLPDIRTEDRKPHPTVVAASDWGPVFRVDALQVPGNDQDYLLLHDGTFGSGIHAFNGDPASIVQKYSNEPRALPFSVLGDAPQHELIIGSAGGNEILASLAFKAPNIEAVELNPVTVDLITKNKKFAEISGHLTKRPDVHLHQGDGRSYLARGNKNYNLVWYVAPDSYAATNAASSGAFVLSESYLYTKQMIKTTLQHLAPDGIMAVQFGELSFDGAPTRTERYVVTARAALQELGVQDPNNHLLVSVQRTKDSGDLSTIIVSRSPVTPAAADRFASTIQRLPEHSLIAAPGHQGEAGPVNQLASGSNAEVKTIVANSTKNITTVTDDAPYFWHFSRFGDVLKHIAQPLHTNNPEDSIGERVLLLLLAISIFYAGIFLLAPFFAVRRTWRALPAKGISFVYFAALGLGFMFFEITMIQRLVQFLGYPTYSLTVTLASILVFAGIGALWSKRFVDRATQVMPILLVVLAALTLFYELALPSLIDGSLLEQSFTVRVLFSLAILAPLGVCLGMFMPLGLGRVSGLTLHGDQYVAWAWAVNGFFSVIGSVLTTILSMSLGFRRVQFFALIAYAIAVLAFTRLPKTPHVEVNLTEDDEAVAAVPV